MSRLFLFLMLCTFFLTGIVPNSLSAAAAITMVLGFIVAIPLIEWNRSLARLLIMYLAGVAVTVTYIVVGMANGATSIAATQIFVTYICFPLVWIVNLTLLFRMLSIEQLKAWMVIFSFIGIGSVAVFFYLFLNFGVDAVLFFIDDPNINLKDGYSAATMHIYGSFIFLTGAFFAVPALVSNIATRYLLLGAFVLVAVTSGRSALIISIFIGAISGLVFLPRPDVAHVANRQNVVKSLCLLINKLLVLGVIGFMLALATDVDFNVIVGDFVNKLLSGGGTERVEQADALLASVKETFGMGAGHGVGVPYVRNEDYPWRYELVWVATLHRVGILGSVIYVLPFCICIMTFLNHWRNRMLTEMDVFMFSGFISALIASNTNPYIEAFSFQWMYILPVVYFLIATAERDKPVAPSSSMSVI